MAYTFINALHNLLGHNSTMQDKSVDSESNRRANASSLSSYKEQIHKLSMFLTRTFKLTVQDKKRTKFHSFRCPICTHMEIDLSIDYRDDTKESQRICRVYPRSFFKFHPLILSTSTRASRHAFTSSGNFF